METINRQFGLIVAYLLPGFIGLGGLALFLPTVAKWLEPAPEQSGWEIGPPVYAVLAAITMGMIFSCFRWLLIDTVHSGTGLKAPVWDADRLEARLNSFNYFVEYHYRYYQFYANTLIAIVWTYSINRWFGTFSVLGPGTDLAVLILCIVLFAGSRDTLTKYYEKTNQLIGKVTEKDAVIS